MIHRRSPRSGRFGRLRRPAVALALLALAAAPADAGPIANGFKQWSMQRQARARVDKPFSHQSEHTDLSQGSTLRRLRTRLAGRLTGETNGFKMTKEPIHLNGGGLSP